MRHVVIRHNDAPPIPLSEAVFLILLSLAAEPRHGYAILWDVREMSRGRVALSTGTLYGALRRILDDGWIEQAVEKSAPRGRSAYRLTEDGTEVLAAEVARMKTLTRLASTRLAGREAS
ncbi:MAG: helix-turn-helix transcriptional regulator [Bryobacteraceae bacterium]